MTGDDLHLPFGDPCPRCGAASSADDTRDRVCVCTPCDVCEKPTLDSCAVCGRSLGCKEHKVTIERHVETYCLASHDEHIRLADLPDELLVVEREQLRANTPKPWPMPVGPWRRAQ